MKVLIIAGGKGTRIQEVSDEIPKALLPVKGVPVAEHQVLLLKGQGFNEFIFCVGHLGDKIRDYFGDGSRLGVKCGYVFDDQPLGTGGPVKAASSLIDDDFLVVFGDIMMEMDVRKMINFHNSHNAVMTFAVHRSDHPEDSSNVKMEADGRIISVGRPSDGHPLTGITRTSIQVLNPEVIDFISGGKVSLEDDVVPALIKAGRAVYGYYTDEFIKDMGTAKRYEEVGGHIRGKNRGEV